jgi:hypothetical protein
MIIETRVTSQSRVGRSLRPSAPRLRRTPKRWLKKLMWCCHAFLATLR